MTQQATLTVADNDFTRTLGIAGRQAVIEREIATHTYSVLVLDVDGLPAGPYMLTREELEVERANDD